MAAATPGRPTLCIVPSNDVLLLAEELQGLGGNDIALANCTIFPLDDSALAADKVAGWLAEGFSATVAPGGCDLELANTFLQHVVARMGSALHLAISWAHVSPTKALNCIGTMVPPVVGLRGAPAVRFSHLGALESILQVEALTRAGRSVNTILTLGVFNPADSTLASLNFIICNGQESNFNLIELMAEVTELHAKRHAGEHLLRSSRLVLLNHLAAPLIAGNARLFIPQKSCPPELENKIEVIKAVCTRAQVPATDLKWIDTEQYLEAAKDRQQQQAQAQTPAPAAHRPASSAMSEEASVERRRQQRARVTSSLHRAAALGAARRSSSGSIKFKTASGEGGVEEAKENQVEHNEVSGSSSKQQQHQQPIVRRSVLPVTKGITELTSPSGTVCYGSPSPLVNKRERPTSSSSNKLSAGGAGSKTGNINSYAAAFRSSLAHPTGSGPSLFNSLSPGRDGFAQAQEEEQQRRLLQEERAPATAALQRRLWASSTAMPPVTDVFNSDSFAFGVEGSNNNNLGANVALQQQQQEEIDDGDNAGELLFDLSAQAAAVASSVARARSNSTTGSYFSSFQVVQEEGHYYQEQHQPVVVVEDDAGGYAVDERELEGEEEGNDVFRESNELFEHTYSQYSQNEAPHSISEAVANTTATAAAAQLAVELEKEKRVNAVLLKQLQEAQERAAMAHAAASSVPAMENLQPGDFDGVLSALQYERLRNTELGQQTQRAVEAQLSLEVELASAQRENAITRARCRALERATPLAHVFAQCEAAVKSAEQSAERLQKENADLARAVAEGELSTLVKSAINGDPSSDTSTVIATLHKKLNTASSQIRKLQYEVAAHQAKARAAESALRGADVNRRTAEDAIRRNAALQEALTAAEARFEEQCLAAAEALAAAEELQRERDECFAALAAEQERADQLLDLAESFRLRAQVGAAYNASSEARSLLTSSAMTPAAAVSSAYEFS